MKTFLVERWNTVRLSVPKPLKWYSYLTKKWDILQAMLRVLWFIGRWEVGSVCPSAEGHIFTKIHCKNKKKINEERKLLLKIPANQLLLFKHLSVILGPIYSLRVTTSEYRVEWNGVNASKETVLAWFSIWSSASAWTSMGAARRAHRNVPEEAGKTGRSTAGNWCEEEEECLSTEPTQTQVSSLNLLFTPQPLGAFLSDISSPPKLGQLLWLLHGMFSQDSPTFYLLEVQYHKPNSEGALLTHASRTGQQITVQQSSQTSVLIWYILCLT